MPIHQQGEDATFQNRSCPRCSVVQHTQVRRTTEYAAEQQDPGSFGNANTPYLNQNQNVNSRGENATIVPDDAWAPQTARTQDNFGYTPVRERADPPDVGSTHALTPDASVAERRRRLVGRYLNDPDVYVSTIRLEPGLSGELQVVITLGMADVL
ncbi:hypothetical protein V8E53_002265 [Lactarius tabidus]